jgi:protease IV
MIAREVELCVAENKKPVVVSMGGAAASGGYYISAKASKIIASPATITGSIGVIGVVPDLSGLLERFKVKYDSVGTSGNSDFASILKPLGGAEQRKISESIASSYDRFVRLVADARGLSIARVNEIAQGRVWTGGQAKERGLVDGLGGISAAVRTMDTILGEGQKTELIEVVPSPAFGLEYLLDAFGSLVGAGLPKEFTEAVEEYRLLKSYGKGEPLYLSPLGAEE